MFLCGAQTAHSSTVTYYEFVAQRIRYWGKKDIYWAQKMKYNCYPPWQLRLFDTIYTNELWYEVVSGEALKKKKKKKTHTHGWQTLTIGHSHFCFLLPGYSCHTCSCHHVTAWFSLRYSEQKDKRRLACYWNLGDFTSSKLSVWKFIII